MKDVNIQSVRYSFKKNLGNYEHEEVSLEVVPTEENDHTIQQILASLKVEVVTFLSGVQPEGQVLEQTTSEEKPKKTKKADKKSAKKEEIEDEKEDIEEESSKESSEEDQSEEEVDSSEEEEEEAPKTAKSSKSSKFKKVTTYDRGNSLHKKLLGDFLTKEVKDWKSKSELAKEISLSLHGSPFLDQEGEILPEFKKPFITKMKKSK